jgi:glycosyltransferase involved in cell wall biosynthesis
MRIGLNLLFLIPGEVGGTETYSRGLITSLVEKYPGVQFYVFINKESGQLDFLEHPNLVKILCPIFAANRCARLLWEQLILPWQVRHLHLDLLHSLGYFGPLWLPCKSVITIHDLNYKFVPQSMSRLTRIVQKLLVEASVHSVDHVIVVSNFVRNQVINFLRISSDKVSAIHEASTYLMSQVITPLAHDIRERYGISKPYIVAFSSLTVHKNISGLIQAFQRIYELAPGRYQLVIIGHEPRKDGTLLDLRQNLSFLNLGIFFTGYLSDPEVISLLANSATFVFPSYYEGFGLPLLEAMSMSVPVVCSNRGSLPEVAGEAALFFDPQNTREMADSILRVLEDGNLSTYLIHKGHQNLTRFSWEKAAAETFGVYQSQLDNVG